MKYHPFLWKHSMHLPNTTSSVCIHLGSNSWAFNKELSHSASSALSFVTLSFKQVPTACCSVPQHCWVPSHPPLPHCLPVFLQWCEVVNSPQHLVLYSRAAPKAQTFLSWNAGSPSFSACKDAIQLKAEMFSCFTAPMEMQDRLCFPSERPWQQGAQQGRHYALLDTAAPCPDSFGLLSSNKEILT